MRIIKKTELKAMALPAIDVKLKELKAELVKTNAQTAVGSGSQNPKRTRQLKRTIAALLTFKNQKSKEGLKKV
jgi:large subunit ribosomal protein L29